MKKYKNKPSVVTIVGTRPEIIKLSCLIPKLEKYFNHTLVHTGQNYDYNLNNIFFKDLNLKKPDYWLNVKSKNTEDTIANIISKSAKILKKIKPNAVLIYGDTNSCLSAISAKKNKIPIFHMEAGNRCFDARVPEEVNRKIIDHISDINLVLSNQAKQNLINEGLDNDKIFKTGSHMFEVINENLKKIENSKILTKLKLHEKKYFIISIHREENVDNDIKLKKILNIMSKTIKHYKNFKFIFSTHPRTKIRLQKLKLKNLNKNINFLKPFNFTDYCKLQKNSYCTISDSGTIFEEASILKFPAITLRDSHERPEGIDSGAVILSNDDDKHFINKIKICVKEFNENKLQTEDYQNYVSSKIIKIINGYTNFIDKKIWYKNF